MNYQEYITWLLDDPKERDDFFEHLGKPLKKSISLINHRLTEKEFIALAKEYQRVLSKSTVNPDASSWYIDRENQDVPLWNHWLHQCGFFYMQELAAGLPASIIRPKKGALVLDMCAAPWGKTSQLATYLLEESDPGLVIANDIQYKRLISLQTNINRVWCYNTAVTKINGYSFGKAVPELFDHVLLDAPCSWEGTSFRWNAATKFWKENDVKKIANIQYQLLVSALKSCKVWGTIVYSTCTINHLENEGNIQRILSEYPGILEVQNIDVSWVETGIHKYQDKTIIDKEIAQKCIRCWPHHQHTGWFFVTHLIKKKPLRWYHEKIHANYNSQFHYWPWVQKEVKKYLKESFGIETNSNHFFVSTKDTIYVTTPKIVDILAFLRCEKVGIPILKKTRDSFRPLHWLATTLGNLAEQNIIELNTKQVQQYTQGELLEVKDITEQNSTWTYPYRILFHQWLAVSISKIIDKKLKNKFIRVG